jgi:hypothetical protein
METCRWCPGANEMNKQQMHDHCLRAKHIRNANLPANVILRLQEENDVLLEANEALKIENKKIVLLEQLVQKQKEQIKEGNKAWMLLKIELTDTTEQWKFDAEDKIKTIQALMERCRKYEFKE